MEGVESRVPREVLEADFDYSKNAVELLEREKKRKNFLQNFFGNKTTIRPDVIDDAIEAANNLSGENHIDWASAKAAAEAKLSAERIQEDPYGKLQFARREAEQFRALRSMREEREKAAVAQAGKRAVEDKLIASEIAFDNKLKFYDSDELKKARDAYAYITATAEKYDLHGSLSDLLGSQSSIYQLNLMPSEKDMYRISDSIIDTAWQMAKAAGLSREEFEIALNKHEGGGKHKHKTRHKRSRHKRSRRKSRRLGYKRSRHKRSRHKRSRHKRSRHKHSRHKSRRLGHKRKSRRRKSRRSKSRRSKSRKRKSHTRRR